MEDITNILDEFKKSHELLNISYPEKIRYSQTGNFTITDRDKNFKFFCSTDLSYRIIPNLSKTQCKHIYDSTLTGQRYTIESLLQYILEFYEEYNIRTKHTASAHFILF